MTLKTSSRLFLHFNPPREHSASTIGKNKNKKIGELKTMDKKMQPDFYNPLR